MFAVPGWLGYDGFGHREFVVAEERLLGADVSSRVLWMNMVDLHGFTLW
jgi:hypothetical protein